jgi:hypothetical protein
MNFQVFSCVGVSRSSGGFENISASSEESSYATSNGDSVCKEDLDKVNILEAYESTQELGGVVASLIAEFKNIHELNNLSDEEILRQIESDILSRF